MTKVTTSDIEEVRDRPELVGGAEAATEAVYEMLSGWSPDYESPSQLAERIVAAVIPLIREAQLHRDAPSQRTAGKPRGHVTTG